MPTPELDGRYQCAQLWRAVGVDNYSNPKVSVREEIRVRWENKSIEILDPRGLPIRVDAVVHSICDIPTDSIMWLGEAKDLPDDMRKISNLMQITVKNYTPDIKGRVIRRTYGLIRFKDKLPVILE